jgi:hypothetical protein
LAGIVCRIFNHQVTKNTKEVGTRQFIARTCPGFSPRLSYVKEHPAAPDNPERIRASEQARRWFTREDFSSCHSQDIVRHYPYFNEWRVASRNLTKGEAFGVRLSSGALQIDFSRGIRPDFFTHHASNEKR